VPSTMRKDQKESLVEDEEMIPLQERREEGDLCLERDDFVIDLMEADIKEKENQLEDDFVVNQVGHLVQEGRDNMYCYGSGGIHCFLF